MPSAKTTTADFVKAETYILHRLQNELVPTLFYHNYHHTFDVINAAMEIAAAEKISEEEKVLLRMAAAFHDSGFIYVYKDHEEKSCEIAREKLPSFGFDKGQIDVICGIIMATRVPQRPINKLEQIICDADLDYFGRDNVFEVAKKLFKESKIYTDIGDEKEWDKMQIAFLKKHHYHTAYAQKARQQKKQEYLEALLKEM
jgi:hypothetical protein